MRDHRHVPAPDVVRLIHRFAIVGCGYVGTALGRRLSGEALDVVGTTTTPARLPELESAGIRGVVLHLSDAEGLRHLLHDREGVVFCAAPGRPGGSHREVYHDGALNIAAATLGSSVRRMLYTSSTRVYAQNDGQWVDESSITQPPDEDGRSLVQAEQTLLHVRGNVTVLRLGGIHGPGRELVARVASYAGALRDDGATYVNLIHLDDIVEVLRLLLRQEHHGILNLTDGRPVSRRELYDEILASLRLPPIRWQVPPTAVLRGKRVSSQRLARMLSKTFASPMNLWGADPQPPDPNLSVLPSS